MHLIEILALISFIRINGEFGKVETCLTSTSKEIATTTAASYTSSSHTATQSTRSTSTGNVPSTSTNSCNY